MVNEFVTAQFAVMRYGTWQAAVMQFSIGEGLRRAVKNRLRSGQTRIPAGVEAIVTNPPFQDAARFVAKALELCPRVCMLMRLAFFEAGELIHKRLDRHLRALVLDSGKLGRIHVFRFRLPMMHRDGWTGKKATLECLSCGSAGMRTTLGQPPLTGSRGEPRRHRVNRRNRPSQQ